MCPSRVFFLSRRHFLFLLSVFFSEASLEDGPGGAAGSAVKGGVNRSVICGAGRGITASPGWESKYKAPIAPRSLSLLCDRPLQSCLLRPQLQDKEREGKPKDVQDLKSSAHADWILVGVRPHLYSSDCWHLPRKCLRNVKTR